MIPARLGIAACWLAAVAYAQPVVTNVVIVSSIGSGVAPGAIVSISGTSLAQNGGFFTFLMQSLLFP